MRHSRRSPVDRSARSRRSCLGLRVGTVLLERALDFMRSQGRVAAVLWVVAENVRARRFYEREGWRADAEEKPSGFGSTELRYSRAL
jgi:GNAT superfamily N-acetyltransferase